MEDNRWPKRIMALSPERKLWSGHPEVKWEKEFERVIKERILTYDDAVNRQLWQRKTGNRWATGTLIDNLTRKFPPPPLKKKYRSHLKLLGARTMTHGLQRVNIYTLRPNVVALYWQIFLFHTPLRRSLQKYLPSGWRFACLLVPFMLFARDSTPPDKRILV